MQVELEELVVEAAQAVELAGSGSWAEMDELRGAVEVAAKKEDTRGVQSDREEGVGVELEEWEALAASEVRQEGSEVRQEREEAHPTEAALTEAHLRHPT